MFARAGTSRTSADASVASFEIHELPAARGCTYVVPSSEYALALLNAAPFGGSERKVAASLGVTDKEIETLCDAVEHATSGEALDPESIRERLGNTVRNLGDEGKKRGMITTLPLALGILQTTVLPLGRTSHHEGIPLVQRCGCEGGERCDVVTPADDCWR